MSNRKPRGFTLVELMVVIAIIAVVSAVFLTIFQSVFTSYMKLQQESSTLSQLSFQSNRITNVLRSITSIESANDTDLTAYVYFYPSDAYVSRVKYSVQMQNGVKTLVADITPMTANPPTGVPDESKKKTVTVMTDFAVPASGKIFTYLNAGGGVIGAPVEDTSIIKSIKLSFGSAKGGKTIQNQDVQIVIRNRKSNL